MHHRGPNYDDRDKNDMELPKGKTPEKTVYKRMKKSELLRRLQISFTIVIIPFDKPLQTTLVKPAR